MDREDFTLIEVGGHEVGLTGLGQVLEEAAVTLAGRDDEEVKTALIERLAKRNYIPGSAREAYGRALLREYRRYLGGEFPGDVPQVPTVRILGPGCPRCEQLGRMVMAVVVELGRMVHVEHVRDPREIAAWGVLSTPAIVIQGKVVSSGRVPERSEIWAWLEHPSS